MLGLGPWEIDKKLARSHYEGDLLCCSTARVFM